MAATVEKLLYSQQDAAYALSFSLRKIAYMIANKQLQTRRKGRRVLIPASEVRRVASMDDFEPCRKQA